MWPPGRLSVVTRHSIRRAADPSVVNIQKRVDEVNVLVHCTWPSTATHFVRDFFVEPKKAIAAFSGRTTNRRKQIVIQAGQTGPFRCSWIWR